MVKFSKIHKEKNKVLQYKTKKKMIKMKKRIKKRKIVASDKIIRM